MLKSSRAPHLACFGTALLLLVGCGDDAGAGSDSVESGGAGHFGGTVGTGAVGANGGALATGGTTGGASNGGTSGGVGSGGVNAGGLGGENTGGSGGASTGGASTGGNVGTGGDIATGGANTGGVATGGSGGAGTGGDASGGAGGMQPDPDSGTPPPPAESCQPSVALRDTSNADHVVGDGTATGCTEQALRNAAEQGGVVRFDCGSSPVTIDITQTIELPNDQTTVIDGGGTVTLDAGQRTRHFYFNHPDWMNGVGRVVLQRLVLINGKAPAGQYFPPLANPECAYGYKEGSGGVIYMRNGNLEVIDSEFYDNEAALLGPDVGGGAIYATGSPSVTIAGSRFARNRGANGGAIGMLFANASIYNSTFEDNTAEGIGMNTAGHAGCPVFGHEGQGGAGGLAGAIYFDGLNDTDTVYVICGSTFRNNRANELAGALFRTPNQGMRNMEIDRSAFYGNTARMGGVSFIKQNYVVVRDSLFSGNRSGKNVAGDDIGGPLGGLWVNTGSVDIVNSTFHDNAPTGLDVEGSGGTLENVTIDGSPFAGSLTIDNSLIVDTNCGGTSSGANNVQWPQGGACAQGTTFADPALGGLADNGGPTETLMPGNPSAVSGIGRNCPPTDQRGQPRSDAACAAGAVEP